MENNLPVRDPVANYEKIKRIGEGTYGVVCKYLQHHGLASFHVFLLSRCRSWPSDITAKPLADKARDRTTGEIVALKKVRMERERDGECLLLDFLLFEHCCMKTLSAVWRGDCRSSSHIYA